MSVVLRSVGKDVLTAVKSYLAFGWKSIEAVERDFFLLKDKQILVIKENMYSQEHNITKDLQRKGFSMSSAVLGGMLHFWLY